MKKTIVFSLAFLLLFGFFISCKKKVEETPPPPPPQVKEQPKVEKVEKPVVVKEPELTEEDIFMQKSLEELNREAPLGMIHFDYDKFFIREDANFINFLCMQAGKKELPENHDEKKTGTDKKEETTTPEEKKQPVNTIPAEDKNAGDKKETGVEEKLSVSDSLSLKNAQEALEAGRYGTAVEIASKVPGSGAKTIKLHAGMLKEMIKLQNFGLILSD